MTKNFSLLTGIPLFPSPSQMFWFRHKLWGGISPLSQLDPVQPVKSGVWSYFTCIALPPLWVQIQVPAALSSLRLSSTFIEASSQLDPRNYSCASSLAALSPLIISANPIALNTTQVPVTPKGIIIYRCCLLSLVLDVYAQLCDTSSISRHLKGNWQLTFLKKNPHPSPYLLLPSSNPVWFTDKMHFESILC